MTATNHGLFGAVIAISLQNNPFIALPLAFASHYILDAVPHFGFDEYGSHLNVKKKYLFGVWATDAFLLSCLLILMIVSGAPLLVFACWFLAGSPDFAWAYRYVFKEKLGKIEPAPMNPLNKFHSWIQWSQTKWGLIIEIPLMIAMFAFVAGKL